MQGLKLLFCKLQLHLVLSINSALHGIIDPFPSTLPISLVWYGIKIVLYAPVYRVASGYSRQLILTIWLNALRKPARIEDKCSVTTYVPTTTYLHTLHNYVLIK